MERSAWIIGGLVAATLTGSAQEGAARNIFKDFSAAFFGAPAQPRYYAPQSESSPLEMTARRHREANRRKYSEVSSKPAGPVVNLDPRTDANWFLKDPTLRRGDIVVTNKGVLVFNGRGNVTANDFASLGGKSGAAWQRQLKAAPLVDDHTSLTRVRPLAIKRPRLVKLQLLTIVQHYPGSRRRIALLRSQTIAALEYRCWSGYRRTA